jgi:hypothetical protein
MLWFKTGPGPVVPDLINLKRLASQSGQRQGCSYDLPAAFHIRTIDVNHGLLQFALYVSTNVILKFNTSFFYVL